MRRVLKVLLIAILGLAALAVLALGFFATPPGHGILAGIIERAASTNGLTVRVEGLGGVPPFSLTAQRITVADSEGVFAEVNDLAIDPKVTALLFGNLAIDTASAARVAIERRPVLADGGSGGDGALLAFAAEDVQIARLELGADIAVRPAVLSVDGSFVSGANGSISAAVTAERIDGQRGALIASVNRADGTAPLSVSVDLSEGADGVLVGLMGRMSGPGYTLSATMGVTGDALEGDMRLSSEGLARFEGQFSLAPLGDGAQRLALNGAGNLADLIPPEYGDLLAGTVNVAVDADWFPGSNGTMPRLVVRQGDVSTSNVKATATGAFGDPTQTLAVTLDVAKADGGVIALPGMAQPTRLDTVALKGTVAPRGDVYRLDLTGNVRGLRTGETSVPAIGLSLAVESRQDTALGQGPLPFDLRVEADAIDTAAGRIAAGEGTPLSLSAGGSYDPTTGSATTRARLMAVGGTADFDGTVSATTVVGDARIAFANLLPLSPLAGRPLSGAIDATATGTFTGETSLTVSGTATDLNVGDPTLARLMEGTTQFTGKAERRADGAIALTDLAVENTDVTARGAVTLASDTIDATLDGSIADLSALANASSGSATFTARISGATARPTVDATISIPEGRLLDQPVDNAVVTVKGAPTDAGWSGALSLAGGFAGRPLTGTADATLDGSAGLLSIPTVDLTIGDNRITGSLQRTADGLLTGELAVDAPNLATLAAFALVQADGVAKANLRFTPDGTRQTITASFTGTNVTYGPVNAASVSGEAQIDDAFGTPLIRGNADGTQVAVGSILLNTARTTATVENGATRFEATAAGPDLSLTGSGTLSGQGGTQTVRIDRLAGTAYRFPVNLNQPVTIALGGETRISGATLALGGGTVTVNGAVSPQLNLTINAAGVSASVINAFAPELRAEGTITAQATVTGEPANPRFQWQVDWRGLRVAQTAAAGLPGMTLTARGNGTRTATSLEGTLAGAGIQLNLSGQVPFSGPGLNVTANGTAPLSLIALESQRELRLGGTARVAINVTGSAASPQITGGVDLNDATIADTETGFGIAGATGRIDFDGSRAVIRSISGRLVQGGTITVSGSVTTTDGSLPADLAIRVVNGRYSDGNIINANFAADLTIRGPLMGDGVVGGTITLARTEIHIPDRLGAGATAIDVTHINAPPGFVPPQPRLRPGSGAPAASSGGGGGLRLDIALIATQGVFVRGGYGIDAEVGGSLRIVGTTGDPQAIGGLQLRRGRMEVLGRRFDFTRGEITFSGSLVPVIDFSATTNATDATVTLNVTGPASQPNIGFTSSPELAEEEILSRLLFQRGVGALSPLQAVQLVDAVAQLTGAIGQGGIFARIRQATGLDDLDIRQSATGGTTVGIGSRINERLRLGVEAGTDAGSGRVTIDLDITQNLKAQAEAGQDGSGKVGLTYEREY